MSPQIAIAKEPQRRRRVWPWVLIGSFLLTIVAPIALIYAFCYEPDTKKVELVDGFDVKNLGTNAMVDCLDYTVSDHKLAISVTENDLDNILEYALNQAGAKSQYIKKAYAKIKGNKYTFYVDLDGIVIKSRLKLITVCEESEDKSAFVFKVKDVALGRLSGIANVAKALTSSFDYETLIQNVFTQVGLSMQFSKKDWSLTYKKADLITDIKKLAGGGEGSSSYLFTVIESLYDNNLVNFGFESNNFLDVSVDLEPLEKNELVTDDKDHLKVPAEKVDELCKNRIIKLVNSGVIDSKEATIRLVFTYFLRGYAPLSDEQKSQIDSYDFSSVGIYDNKTYAPDYGTGFTIDNDTSVLFNQMKDELIKLKDIVTSDAITNKEVVLMDEKSLNSYIASRDLSSSLVYMDRNVAANDYKFNYIIVDNFYCNIYKKGDEQLAELVCKLNINGYHTSLTMDTNATVINNEALQFKVKDNGVKFGNIQSADLDKEFFELAASAIGNGGGNNLEANKDEKTITFKFGGMVNTAKTSIHDTLYATAMDKMDASLPALLSPFRNDFNEFVDNSINGCLEEILDGNNAGIEIDGENRDADGVMKLVLKNFDYKDKFKKRIKDAYEKKFSAAQRALFEAPPANFNIDKFTNQILGIE